MHFAYPILAHPQKECPFLNIFIDGQIGNYVNNGNSYLDNGSSFTTTGTSDAYVTVYSKGTSDDINLNYNANSGMKGDAVYETSKTSTSSVYQTSWFSDYSNFLYSSASFFYRGGGYGDGALAGAFCFGRSGGGNYGSNGFRPVLAMF